MNTNKSLCQPALGRLGIQKKPPVRDVGLEAMAAMAAMAAWRIGWGRHARFTRRVTRRVQARGSHTMDHTPIDQRHGHAPLQLSTQKRRVVALADERFFSDRPERARVNQNYISGRTGR